MNEATLKALKASIKHWEENLAAETPVGVSIWSNSCALCQRFALKDCQGCPVYAATGLPDCRATPYRRAGDTFLKWKDNPYSQKAKAAWRKAAKAELDFLKSLLPQVTP